MDSFEARRATREAVRLATARLIAEFADVPAGSVIRTVARAREELLRSGLRDGLVPATEARARDRLRLLAPARAM